MSQQRVKGSTIETVIPASDSDWGQTQESALGSSHYGEPSKCVSASHSILFEEGDERCSVCAELLEDEDDDDDSAEIRGSGLLVWARGEERRYEEPQLCPSCAAAIGVSALQRWEIEEDEG